MTKRAKIAAEHRDAKNPVNADPDKPSTGKKIGGKHKPWVVEYKFPQDTTENIWWFEKHDGQWHPYSGNYETEKAATQALSVFSRQRTQWIKAHYPTNADLPEFRIRNTRIKE